MTFGQSFHWTDEQRVAETVYDLLEPGGALALIVHTVTGRPRPPDPGAPPILHDEIKALVAKYLGSTWRAGQGTDDFAGEVRALLASCSAEGISGTGRATPRW